MSKSAEYFELTITCAPGAGRDLLMAEMITAGFEGFNEEGDALKAFIPIENEAASGWKALLTERNLSWTSSVIADQNWNAEWESSFEPVRVEDFCVVRADFHQADPTVQYDLVITPKMSFGTGHHATTYQMLQAMKEQDFRDKRVFDFGTGTGVLAILAEKLGAMQVMAIDNDDWSINNGLENLERNACSRISILLRDTLPARGEYDIMLANINRNVIVENMRPMAALLVSSGIMLLSGFLQDDLPFIKTALEENDLKLTSYTEKNGWLCVRASR